MIPLLSGLLWLVSADLACSKCPHKSPAWMRAQHIAEHSTVISMVVFVHTDEGYSTIAIVQSLFGKCHVSGLCFCITSWVQLGFAQFFIFFLGLYSWNIFQPQYLSEFLYSGVRLMPFFPLTRIKPLTFVFFVHNPMHV